MHFILRWACFGQDNDAAKFPVARQRPAWQPAGLPGLARPGCRAPLRDLQRKTLHKISESKTNVHSLPVFSQVETQLKKPCSATKITPSQSNPSFSNPICANKKKAQSPPRPISTSPFPFRSFSIHAVNLFNNFRFGFRSLHHLLHLLALVNHCRFRLWLKFRLSLADGLGLGLRFHQ